MPQPAEVTDLVEQLLKLFRGVQASIDGQVAAAATDPSTARRRRRLAELRRSIDAELTALEADTAGWLQGNLPAVYELGGAQGASSVGDTFSWTQIHVDAVQHLAGDLYGDVLQATSFVRDDVKAWIRETSRRETSLALLEGRTAEQAAAALEKAAAGEAVALLGGPVGVIRYVDGSYRSFADYSDMLLRTKTAQAYNAGTLNVLKGADVGWVEILDGNGCGLTSHDDGNTANGQVVELKVAFDHPLSHPRCRRSFIGRPDVTTAKEAKDAKRSTTDAQRADQIQAEKDRADRVERARRARERQGRPPRTPRPAQRTTRTPRAPRATATPAPAPAAVPTPVGVDPATALSRTPGPRSVHGRGVADGLDAIRTVHRVPEGMPKIPVISDDSYSYAGAYRSTVGRPGRPSHPVSIALSRKQDLGHEVTFVHEYGHFLDHAGIGIRPDQFATIEPGDRAMLAGWRQAIDDSAAVRRMRAAGDWSRAERRGLDEYVLTPEELWARSYSQWIALRSGNPRMAGQVQKMATGRIPYQWADDDFAPIAAAFDDLFSKLGLLA